MPQFLLKIIEIILAYQKPCSNLSKCSILRYARPGSSVAQGCCRWARGGFALIRLSRDSAFGLSAKVLQISVPWNLPKQLWCPQMCSLRLTGKAARDKTLIISAKIEFPFLIPITVRFSTRDEPARTSLIFLKSGKKFRTCPCSKLQNENQKQKAFTLLCNWIQLASFYPALQSFTDMQMEGKKWCCLHLHCTPQNQTMPLFSQVFSSFAILLLFFFFFDPVQQYNVF